MFPKGQVNQSLMSFTKNATCKSGIVLVSLRTSYPDRSNQVLAKEYSGCLLVYILRDMSQSEDESYL
jgi:hypothetical protein